MNLKYEDLVKLEGSFLKPTLEKVRKAIQTIFEGKTTRLVGSDFDKNIVFFVDKDLKKAKFEVNEDKVKLHSVEEVLVDTESFGQKFQSLMSEAIDLLSENKEADSKSKFNDAIEVLRRELSGDKTTIFDKRPPLCENKVSIKNIKLFKENKKQIVKDLAKNLSDLMESYYGKNVIKDSYFEVSLNEGKSNEIKTYEKEPSLLRKVDIAKKSAKTVDMKPIFEDVQKWISENEEVFFLTSDKFKERLVEAAKADLSATKDKINEAVKIFSKMRSENEGFRKLADQVLKEQLDDEGGMEPEIGDDRDAPERDDLDDKVVSDVDRKSEEDKLGFMRQFVDILEKLLTKIKEVSDDEEVQRRVDFAVDTINKAKEENIWDKDELAEIAKEAIELAAKVEGIEPTDTEISRRSEESGEEEEMGRETISGDAGVPGEEEVGMEPEIGGEVGAEPEIGGEEEIPGEEGGKEDIFKPRKKRELDEEAVISPDGDITYGNDDEGEGIEGIDTPMEKLTCYGCERDFSVEGGEGAYKCPYCGEDVDGFGGEETGDVGMDGEADVLTKAEYQPHPQEPEMEPDLEQVPVEEDDGMGNADQSSVNETKMSTNPTVGKIEKICGTELSDSGPKMSNKPNIQKKLMKNVEGSTEGIIDKSGEKMSSNPAKGSQEVVDGTKLPSTGKKMSKKPSKGKMEYADGTKLPDSGKKMSMNPATGKMEKVKGSTEGIIDKGGSKMSTNPAVGKIETLKEGVPSASTKLTGKKFGKALPEAKVEDDDVLDDSPEHEELETPGEERAEHMPGGEEFGGGEGGVDVDDVTPTDIDPAGAVAPEADVAPIDTDAEMPVDMDVDAEMPVDTEVGADMPIDVPEVGAEVGAAEVGVAVGGSEVDIAVDSTSQTSGKLPDTGEQMSTNPPVGEVETVGENGDVPPVVRYGDEDANTESGEGEDFSATPNVGADVAAEPGCECGEEECDCEFTEEELNEAWVEMNSDKWFLKECKIHKKMNEVAPPGWEGTVKAMKKHKDITNPWALSWHMRGKGMKPHKNECGRSFKKSGMRKSLKSVKEIEEARATIQKIREGIERDNGPKCSSCKKSTEDLYEDPKTWGGVSNSGQEYLCLECLKRDFPYMVKETENVAEMGTEAAVEEASYLPKDADVLGTYGSKSNPTRKYYIVKGKDGVTYCTCPSWKFSKDQPKCCKHLNDFTGGGSGRVTDEETNEEFVREMNSPAIDPTEEQELTEDDKPYTEGPGAKAAGTALPDKAKPFTKKPIRRVK